MAIHIIQDPGYPGGVEPIIADRPLYTDAAGERLLEEGDKDCATLVVSHAGKVIPEAYVVSLGLEAGKDGAVKQRKDGQDKERVAARDKEATPPKDDGSVGAPIVSAGAAVFAGLGKAALNKIAKERGVPGYTKMSDEELRAALAEGGAMQAGGTHPG